MELKTNYEINDSELVYYVREGNDDAKDELYRKYTPLIHKEINRVKKRAFIYGIEYADLCQEAMLAFSHAVSNYSDVEDVKFITFATTCLRRRLLNYIIKLETTKNKNMISSIALDEETSEKKKLIDQIEETISNEPLKRIIDNETLSEISVLIDEKLSKNEKLALGYNLSGKNIDEIATVMGMNTKQIYNLIHRARHKLKFPQ